MRAAFGYIRPYRARLALVVVLSLASTALSLAQPYLSKVLVDRALLGRDLRALTWTVAGFLALTAGSLLLNVVSGLRYTRVSADILFDMRLDVFRHLQRLSPRWFTRMARAAASCGRPPSWSPARCRSMPRFSRISWHRV